MREGEKRSLFFPLLKKIKKKPKNQILKRTFLDEELRIGRGDKGSVFVTARRRGTGGQAEEEGK